MRGSNLAADVARLEERVQRLELERGRPFVEYATPNGARVRIGVQEGGRVGVRVWGTDGGLAFDHTTAGA